MSQYVETACKAFTAGAARAAFLRVYLNGTTLTTAGASNPSIGSQDIASLAATDIVPVRLRTAQGTRKLTAAGPISSGAAVYAAASGKVDASGTVYEGIALEAAGADGDVIEVMDIPNTDVSSATTGTTAASFTVDSDSAGVKIKLDTASATGNYTATIAAANLSGNITITLPAAAGTLATLAGTESLSTKTLASPVITGLTTNSYTGTPVAAAGSTVADAGQLPSTRFCHITSDGATKGVKLPAVTGAGIEIIIINNSGTAAELYAESTGTVNGGSADASVVIPASKGVLCISTAAKTWKVFDLAAAASAS